MLSLLAAIMLKISLHYHNENFKDEWKRELFVDAGGYYLYNLMWLEYGYESKNFPDSLDVQMGHSIGLKNKIVKDKYTCGVAYLQLPFVFISKQFACNNNASNPLSKYNNKTIDFIGIFYFWLGSIILFLFLSEHVRKWIALLSVILIATGTNVFAYAVYHPGMAHIYSFFLFSIYLFIGDKWLVQKKWIQFLALSITLSFIVLIRPTDILFLPALLFIRNKPIENLKQIFTLKNIVTLGLSILIVWLPQFYYWYISSGSIIHYSYGSEGFPYLFSPKITQVIFAPDNGLLLYSPLFIVLFISNIYLITKKHPFSIYYLLYQIIAIYLFASWHMPNFGGAYGQRNFVQIFAGYSLILALTLEKVFNKKLIFIPMVLLGISTVIVNQKVLQKFDHFFWGKHTWDWTEYKYYLTNNKYTKNCEPSIDITSNDEFYEVANFKYTELPKYFKYIEYSYNISPLVVPFKLEICMKWIKNEQIVFYKSNSMYRAHFNSTESFKVVDKSIINAPDSIPTPEYVNISIWNLDKQEFYITNLKFCIK